MNRSRRGLGAGSDESLRSIVAGLDRQERVARRRAARQAARQTAEPRERPAPLPPLRPTGRPPWPTQAEIDSYVARMISDPVAGVAEVSAELYQRFAAREPTEKGRQRAMGTVTALVATSWQARLAGR